MRGSLSAELMLLRKRTAIWVLLVVWSTLATLFVYLLPYLSYTGTINRRGGRAARSSLLPQNLVNQMLGAFPAYGGLVVLILGVLAIGNEFGWDTLKTVYTQRPSRLRVFFAKIVALAILIVPFVLAVFALAAAFSLIIARREGATVDWPPVWTIVRAVGVAWLVLAVWTAFGVVLAMAFQGTALAVGLGIMYGLVIEGLISAFGRDYAFLHDVSTVLLRTNTYSLVEALGVHTGADGPGAFFGPAVGGWQAFLVLSALIAAFLALSAFLLRWRDVI